MRPGRCACIAALMTAAGSTLHAQQRWTVEPTPIVDIHGGTAAGEPMFASAIAGTRLSNGTIVIGDALGSTIRFFDPGGKPVRTVGRRGSGPGEVQMLTWLGRCAADTVFAYDRRQARMLVVSPSGEVVRQYRVPAEETPGPAPAMLACNGAGTFAMIVDGPGPVSSEDDLDIMRRRGALWIVGVDGRIASTADTVTLGEFIVIGGGGAPRPLARATTLAMSHDRIWVGTADSASVRSYGLDGRSARSIPAGVAGRRTTPAHYEAAVDAILASAPPQARDRMRPVMMEWRAPSTLPPYSAIRTDTEGNLWVVSSPPGSSAVELRASAPDGRTLGDLRIDLPLTVFEIGRDYVLGTYEDAGGEPHVVLLRLRRS